MWNSFTLNPGSDLGIAPPLKSLILQWWHVTNKTWGICRGYDAPDAQTGSCHGGHNDELLDFFGYQYFQTNSWSVKRHPLASVHVSCFQSRSETVKPIPEKWWKSQARTAPKPNDQTEDIWAKCHTHWHTNIHWSVWGWLSPSFSQRNQSLPVEFIQAYMFYHVLNNQTFIDMCMHMHTHIYIHIYIYAYIHEYIYSYI